MNRAKLKRLRFEPRGSALPWWMMMALSMLFKFEHGQSQSTLDDDGA